MSERRQPLIALRASEVEELVGRAIPDARVVEIERVTQGRCNTNYRVVVDGRAGALGLRLVARAPEEAGKEVAVLRAVSPVIPVPEILYAETDAQPPFYVCSWLPGSPLSDRSASWTEALGAQLGAVLGAIHTFGFATAGQLDADLQVSPWDFGDGPSTEADFVAACLSNPRVAERLGDELHARLAKLWEDTAALRAETWFPPCLVHGDFNPTNLLLDGDCPTGVLDWEWAHAGSPLSDFGNILRDRNEPVPTPFAAALAEAWEAKTGAELPSDWAARVRLADLSSGLEFLSSEDDRPTFHATARANIVRTVESFEVYLARPRTSAWARVGAVVGRAAVNAGKAVAGAARAIDPDLRRHFVQMPLLAFSYLTRGRVPVEPQPDDGHRAVVFVHGLGGRRGNFLAMATWFHLHGRKRRYAVGMGDLGSVPDKARRLGDFLLEVARVNGLGSDSIDIVAHSLGGVVSRVALENPEVRAVVARIVTLGSPHGGTHAARYLATDTVLALRPDGETIATLAAQTPWPPGPDWPVLTALWSDVDMLIVPPENAKVTGADNVLMPGSTHVGFLIETRAFRATLDALS